jgi:hypothetical protein
MTDSGELTLQVHPGHEDDAEELPKLTVSLRGELLVLDVAAVEEFHAGTVPAGVKGVSAVVGWLAVQLGSESLRTVLAKIADWAIRNDRSVEVTYGSDTLKLTRATRHQQEKIIDAWLARHPASP